MKLFNHRSFDRALRLSILLLVAAGIGWYYAVRSFMDASTVRPSHEEPYTASLALLSVLSAVTLIALGVAVSAATALLRREALRRRRTEFALDAFRRSADASSDLITILTASGRIEYVNAAVEWTTGYRRDELITRGLALRPPWYGDAALARRMRKTVLAGNEFSLRIRGTTKARMPVILEERVVPFRNRQGKIVRLISTARDLTRELALETRIDHLRRIDQLTGLPNRISTITLLEQTLRSAKTVGAFVSVLVFNIDRFKYINGLCGVGAGDEILKQAGLRIRSSVSPDDIVGRTGNDEFTVIHVDSWKPVLARAIAQRVQTALALPFPVLGQEIALTLSGGFAVHPDDGDTASAILTSADLALEGAKTLGRNVIQAFDSSIACRAREFFILERRLCTALSNNEYLLYYQPYHDLRSKKITGAEALIRWKTPDLGMVSPSKFVPCLEDTGKMIEVGRWILETACSQSKEWERRNCHVPVSVNLSLLQFRHQDLVGMVKEAINDHRIDPARLTLEVTETVFMEDTDFAIKTMKRLKDLGVALSVDDFGTGYSSLSYIKRLPVDNLKIDISFVRDVTSDQDATSIVSAITTLARNLQLKTIAEGVETEEQRNILHLLRCDMGQGYLFSPPLDAQAFDNFLA